MTHEKSVFENKPDDTAFGCFHKLSPIERRRLMHQIIDDDNDDDCEALLGSLEGVDGRTAIARRWHDLYAEITADLGGPDALSEVERQLARRCATLSVEAEAMEAASAGGGGELDIDKFVVLTNALGRALARLACTGGSVT